MTFSNDEYPATEGRPFEVSAMGQVAQITEDAQSRHVEDLADLFACQRRLDTLGRLIGRDAR